MDGVTLGQPCCGYPNCKIPLINNHHRFCPTHEVLNNVCVVVGCGNRVVSGKKTCSLAEHQAIEDVHNTRGQARFQLKERLQQSNLAHPNDSVGIEVDNVTQLVEDDDSEEVFDTSISNQPIPVSPDSAPKKKLRAQFGQ